MDSLEIMLEEDKCLAVVSYLCSGEQRAVSSSQAMSVPRGLGRNREKGKESSDPDQGVSWL